MFAQRRALQRQCEGQCRWPSSPNVALPSNRASLCLYTAACTQAAATDRGQPIWTGESLLSAAVNWMINTKPIFEVMKLGAKSTMKSTVKKAGIDWDDHVRSMQQQAELQQLHDEFSRQPSPDLQYPPYYTVPFHSYEQGNLNWLAAYEVEPASYAISLRTFKNEQLTAEEAMTKLRTGINDQIQVRWRTVVAGRVASKDCVLGN
eukprot:GHRR01014448.1.p1 GENE.GHRR01014448.1~~GHRR01014448.1.p1  ORF type:complete len:205 (+),score=45.22 GHRR01014448.1:179-793(+)